MKSILQRLLLTVLAIGFYHSVRAQYMASDSTFDKGNAMTGHLWGYAFGDYLYKGHSDSLKRGGSNQYSGMEEGTNEFAFRRIYLGYDFNLSPKFSTELLLAAEDNTALNGKPTNGDLLSNGKYTFYIKYANLRWKNFWKGSDLIIGQTTTPAFSKSSENVWRYRSVERTIADNRRTPSFDLGVSLQGRFDRKGNFGYNLMVGNGTGARPENNKFKQFYGDIWAKFFNKKLTVDLYSDYQRLDYIHDWHHTTNMIKLFVGYTTTEYSLGVEGFINNRQQDVSGIKGSSRDTLNELASGISFFGNTQILKDKLVAFARLDLLNPDLIYHNQDYQTYEGSSAQYNPNTREQFSTVGLDYTPVKNVHFMPNIWYTGYHNQEANITNVAKYDYDLVYRLTFYYVFGK